jgi:uncharacterized protein with beta-barrel porin domain
MSSPQCSSVASSPNQRAVGTALEVAQASGDPDVATVFGELNTMLAADIPDALDAMAGEQLTQFATVRLGVGERFHASLQERIRGVGRGESDALLSASGAPLFAASRLGLGELAGADLGSGATVALAGATLAMQQPVAVDVPEPAPLGFGAWIGGYGLFGHVSGGSGTDDFDSTIWGISAGLDRRVAERWIVGAAGGWAHSELDFDDLQGSPEVLTAQGAAYAGYVSELLEAGAAFRFGWNRMSLDREIAFAAPSTLSRTADSEFDGIDLGEGFRIRPELRGRWLHEFGDRERKLEARIGGVPGASYDVQGTELPRDTGTVGLDGSSRRAGACTSSWNTTWP